MHKMGLLGKKVGMTQIFTEQGIRIPVTVVATGPCVVLAKRSPDKDGYSAVQFGFDDRKPSRVNRPDLGRFRKVETEPKAFVRELRLPEEAVAKFEVGQAVKVEDVFAVGDMVDVTGHTHGKGYQGVIKRHHMAGMKASHGVHEFYRHGGSIGCRLTPGRVVKGRRMAGQMGNTQVTVPNLRVVQVRSEEGLLLIRGAIPGGENNYVIVRYAQKKPIPERANV